jgi:hypothetical protein
MLGWLRAVLLEKKRRELGRYVFWSERSWILESVLVAATVRKAKEFESRTPVNIR